MKSCPLCSQEIAPRQVLGPIEVIRCLRNDGLERMLSSWFSLTCPHCRGIIAVKGQTRRILILSFFIMVPTIVMSGFLPLILTGIWMVGIFISGCCGPRLAARFHGFGRVTEVAAERMRQRRSVPPVVLMDGDRRVEWAKE